jgi:hypothetical protein
LVGGWTLISNLVLNESTGMDWSLANDYRQIDEYDKNLGLSTDALRILGTKMSIKQLRFFCHKKIPGRYFHIATETISLVTTLFVTSQIKQTLSPFPVDLIISSLTTTQYLQAIVLNGVIIFQIIMLVNGIMQEANLMIVCSIIWYFMLSKLTGS